MPKKHSVHIPGYLPTCLVKSSAVEGHGPLLKPGRMNYVYLIKLVDKNLTDEIIEFALQSMTKSFWLDLQFRLLTTFLVEKISNQLKR